MIDGSINLWDIRSNYNVSSLKTKQIIQSIKFPKSNTNEYALAAVFSHDIHIWDIRVYILL